MSLLGLPAKNFTELIKTRAAAGVGLHAIAKSAPSDAAELYRSALAQYGTEVQLPSRKNEAWKYTSCEGLLAGDLRTLDVSKDVPTNEKMIALAREALGSLYQSSSVFMFFAGRLVCTSFSGDDKVAGVEYRSGFADLKSDSVGGVFGAINLFTLSDLFVLHIKRSASVEKPIVLVHVHGTPGGKGMNDVSVGDEKPRTLSSTRFQLTLEENSSAKVLEIHLSETSGKAAAVGNDSVNSGDLISTHFGEVTVKSGAKLEFVRLENLSADAAQVSDLKFFVDRDGSVSTSQISLGAKWLRQDLLMQLRAEGAHGSLLGLYLENENQHVDNHTCIEHTMPHTTSEQVYKGILSDQSRAVFNGRVWIKRDAQKSNSSQLNKNLILNPRAEVDTKPELEIDADDVKAAHGAAIGQLDPEHLFYLQTRAIPREQAIPMLAEGFALDVIEQIGSASVRECVRSHVRTKLAQLKTGFEVGV